MSKGLPDLYESLRTNFWFVPSLMLFGALALALALLHLDADLDPGVEAKLLWAYSGGPEGARSLLSTVAGSMITAASVTFSLASVALSLASQQYGSRVLRNFMRDTVTQVMLGTFVATFFYSVLVVRAIRGSDYAGGFVPAISITFGIVLTLISLICLVYFIHHVSESIQASKILDVIMTDLKETLPKLYPSETGEPAGAVEGEDLDARMDSAEVALIADGYLQSAALDDLLEIASRKNLIFDLQIKPGDFVLAGSTAMRVYGAATLDEKDLKAVIQSFSLGGERTPTQDIRYQFQQLTDVIVRALSPGINDPFTAINGIEQLSSGLVSMKRRASVDTRRRDGEGRLRLRIRIPTVEEVLDETVGHIGIYADGDRFVMDRLWKLLAALEPMLTSDGERHTVGRLRAEMTARQAAKQPGKA